MAAVPSIGRATLVEASTAAEATATHALYERHAARIHAYCLQQLRSREEAEDALQTVFMNAFRALRKGVVPESELAWLYKIAENVCLSRRRSSWRRNRVESPADFAVIEEVVAGPNRQRDELIGIEAALAAMPEQQRRAILLREWQGLSYREISDELGLTQSAVETLIFRARRSLAQGLTEPQLGPPRRGVLRRARRVLDLTGLVGLGKSLLAGSAAAKAATAAIAVTAIAGGVTVAPQVLDPAPKPPLEVLGGLPPQAKAAVERIAAARADRAAATEVSRAVAAPAGSRPAKAQQAARVAAKRATVKPPLPAQAKPPAHAGPKVVPPGLDPERTVPAGRPAKTAPPQAKQKPAQPAKTKAQPARGKSAQARSKPERTQPAKPAKTEKPKPETRARQAATAPAAEAELPGPAAEVARGNGKDARKEG